MSEESTCNCPCGCDNPLSAGTCVDCSENTGHQNNNDLDEYRLCEVCNKNDDGCECEECGSCGEKEDPYEFYEGRCRSCEDKQMVRGIW